MPLLCVKRCQRLNTVKVKIMVRATDCCEKVERVLEEDISVFIHACLRAASKIVCVCWNVTPHSNTHILFTMFNHPTVLAVRALTGMLHSGV